MNVIHGIRIGAHSVLAGMKAVHDATKSITTSSETGSGSHSHARKTLCAAPPVYQVPRVAISGGTVGGLLAKTLAQSVICYLQHGRVSCLTLRW
jgi:hypothetical protein